MTRDLWLPFVGWGTLVIVPGVVLALLLANPSINIAPNAPLPHFFITSLGAGAAFVVSLFLGRAAIQVREPRVLFFALAFMSMGGFFSLHGLSTPQVLLPKSDADPNGTLSGLMAYGSLFTGAVFLALSTVELPFKAKRWFQAHATGIIVGATVVLLLLVAISLPLHKVFDRLPSRSSPRTYAIASMTLLLLLFALYRHVDAYLMARLRMQWSIVSGLLLLGGSQVAMVLSQKWTWSWWEYHLLMLAGFLAVAMGLLLEYGRGHSLWQIMRGVFRMESLVETELGNTDSIAALAAATESRDSDTRGHTARVAEIAVLIGEELRLSKEQLRSLARAGLLHDIGKLGIPDSILLKPGPLTPEEFEIMKRHPDLGHEIVARLGSMERETELIRMHHEWLDGNGYPRGLKGDEIPLEARILAVADVYDSLVTDRPYRPAFPRERALEILGQEAGVHLDSNLVQVWTRLSAGHPGRNEAREE